MQQLSTQTGKWLHWWADKYYSWQVERKYQRLNPFADIKRPTFYLPLQYPDVPCRQVIQKRLRRLNLTDEQVLLIRLLFETGMKKREIVLLSFDNVDYVNKSITIPGLKTRTISISKELANLLKQSRESLPRMYIFKDTHHLSRLLQPILIWAGLKVKGNAFNLFRQVFLLDTETEHGLDELTRLSGYGEARNLKYKIKRLKSPVVRQIELALVKCLRIHTNGGKE